MPKGDQTNFRHHAPVLAFSLHFLLFPMYVQQCLEPRIIPDSFIPPVLSLVTGFFFSLLYTS